MEFSAEVLGLGLIWFVAFLFSTTIHEAAHAWAALRLGDPTAYHGGQVTLNPLPHIRREPMGMIVVPLISYAFAGWTMGWASAPYDPHWADRYPKRAALMALAGPLSNLAVVILAGLSIRVGIGVGVFEMPLGLEELGFTTLALSPQLGMSTALGTLISVLFTLNLILFAFNLLPVPPLDGSAIIPLVLNDSWTKGWKNFIQQPMMGLFGIVIAWNIFPEIFFPIYFLALYLLYPGIAFG